MSIPAMFVNREMFTQINDLYPLDYVTENLW